MRSQFDDHVPRPDVPEVVAQVSEAFRRNARRLAPALFGVLLAALLASGFYVVGPGEAGVVRTFGRVTATVEPGLHYRWPIVQRRNVVSVKKIERLEVGFRGEKKELDEARMLTGDENIVEASMIIQYRISDPVRYLFRLHQPEEVLRATSEVALRTVVARTRIDDLLTDGREAVQAETIRLLQELMDQCDSGIAVVDVKLQQVEPPEQVKDAFDDVVRAREERAKLVNQARGYHEDQIPRARGEAERVKREAEAYRTERVQRARGDVARFEAQLAEYAKAKRVTRDRLYLETMERVLGKVDRKILVDGEVSRGILPLLPLGAAAAASASPAPQAGGKP
ncbi:MAG TPA: FtsH protease activity modulator HflK [Polyangiaceae bacterium]|nr:FtsH protease activity modulator HflK [Polyangiaceae bacterium]